MRVGNRAESICMEFGTNERVEFGTNERVVNVGTIILLKIYHFVIRCNVILCYSMLLLYFINLWYY